MNHTTGAQRYNARMDKIWEKAKAHGALCDDIHCTDEKHIAHSLGHQAAITSNLTN